jgi:putative ABC transport system permease protein
MLGKLLTIAMRNLRRQRRRTIFTALTFAVAVFIYTVLVAVPLTMDRIADNASKGLRLVVTGRDTADLPAKHCNSINKMPHVLGCAPELLWNAMYRDPRDSIATYGITPDLSSVSSSSDYVVPPEIIKRFWADKRTVLVGADLMHAEGWKVGEPFTLRDPRFARITFTFIPIAALPTEYLSRAFWFHRSMFDDEVKNVFGADIKDRAAFLVVRVDRAENMGLVASEIDENFHNSEAETDTNTESDSVANVITTIGDIKTIIYSLCLVVLLTVLLIAANSMAMMVRDRTSEVAVMRALGFQRTHIATLLLSEAALIGLSGASLGAVAALVKFGNGVSLGAVTGMLGYMEVRPEIALAAVAVAFAVSIAAAALPVMRAMRIAPAIAFRKVI